MQLCSEFLPASNTAHVGLVSVLVLGRGHFGFVQGGGGKQGAGKGEFLKMTVVQFGVRAFGFLSSVKGTSGLLQDQGLRSLCS